MTLATRLEKYCLTMATSGREEPMIRAITEDFVAFTKDITVDSFGNVMARFEAASPTMTRSSGGDVFDMKEQVGHSDIRTTINIYGRIFKEDKVQIAQNLNTKLENVHKMCTEAENNVKFAEIVSQNPLQIKASKAVDSDDAQVRPTDYGFDA